MSLFDERCESQLIAASAVNKICNLFTHYRDYPIYITNDYELEHDNLDNYYIMISHQAYIKGRSCFEIVDRLGIQKHGYRYFGGKYALSLFNIISSL